jgi:hypothetical protein
VFLAPAPMTGQTLLVDEGRNMPGQTHETYRQLTQGVGNEAQHRANIDDSHRKSDPAKKIIGDD